MPGTPRPPAIRAPGSTVTSPRSHASPAGSRRPRSTPSTGTSRAACCSTSKPPTPTKPTRLTRLLHLRLEQRTHDRSAAQPAFQTSNTAPHAPVLGAARRLARISRITFPTLATHLTMIHSDPLTALPARNSFLRTVTPFLKHLTQRAVADDRNGLDTRLLCRKVEPGGRRGDQRVAAPSSWMNVLCGVGASPTSASIARSRTRTTCDHVLLVEADDQDEARLRIRAALGGREEFDARQPVDSWTVITRRLARRQRAARGSAANSGVVYCSQHVERGAAAAVRDVSGRASQHLHRKGRRRRCRGPGSGSRPGRRRRPSPSWTGSGSRRRRCRCCRPRSPGRSSRR